LGELVKEGIDPQRLKVSGLGPGPNRVDFIIESRAAPKRVPVPVPAAIPVDPNAPSAPSTNPAPAASPQDGPSSSELPAAGAAVSAVDESSGAGR